MYLNYLNETLILSYDMYGLSIFMCHRSNFYCARISVYPQSLKSHPFALEMCIVKVSHMFRSLPY